MRIGVWVPYSIMLMAAIFLGPTVGGKIESLFHPILVNNRIENLRTSGRPHEVCWTWIWAKTRAAAPRAIRYYVQVAQSDMVPLFVQRDNAPMAAIERPPGWHSANFCAVLPPNVPPEKAKITGHIIYDMPHGLWDVRQDLPEIEIGDLT